MRYVILLICLTFLFLVPLNAPSADAGDAPLKIVNLEKLNGPGDEEDPCITPDGFGLLYSMKVGDASFLQLF